MEPKEKILASLKRYREWKRAEAEYKKAVESRDEVRIQSALEKAADAYVAYQSLWEPGEEKEL